MIVFTGFAAGKNIVEDRNGLLETSIAHKRFAPQPMELKINREAPDCLVQEGVRVLTLSQLPLNQAGVEQAVFHP